MAGIYPLLRPLFMAMEPENAHKTALHALRLQERFFFSPPMPFEDDILKTRLWGMEFQNPLGLAAGFDKDAEALAPLFRLGFGFIEAGTVTPQAQEGNPRPRIFRDAASGSVINRMGFPGKGLEVFAENVMRFRQRYPALRGILGINIGINKDTPSPLEDYRQCLKVLGPLAGYITVNISSPNTEGLRSLQMKEALEGLVEGLAPFRSGRPLLIKVAPDLPPGARADIAEIVLRQGIDGIVAGNSTLTRPPALSSVIAAERGGLSGRLLAPLATEVIRDFYRLTQGRVPIIGVGGISSAADAYEKIRAGAALIQLYTALVYQGPEAITRILEGLAALLRQDGFSACAEAVGSEKGAGKRVMKAVL